MNKAEFIDSIADKSGLNKKKSATALDAVLDVITETLSKNETISFMGFCSFTVVSRAARVTKIPGTDRKVNVPAKKVVKFKVGKTLKLKVAGNNNE